jgi:PhnB protein
MQLNPYLSFNGQCEAAFKFHEKCLGGKIEAMMPHEGTPAADHVPAEWRSKVLHARMVIDDQVLMASDAPPDQFHTPQGFSVSIQIKDGRGRTRIPGTDGKRVGDDADGGDILGRALWYAGRSIRNTVDD